MFYSHYILAKKGPLGTIWIAAHLERKLRKNQVNETDISTSVDSILFPEVPIALRLSGHLLLGVVRIYSRKVNYLFQDCNDALIKLKSAFASSAKAAVNLPPEAASAPFHAITLPEHTFEFDSIEFDGIELGDALDSLDHHVTTRDQITLEEPLPDDVYPGSQFDQEERFAQAPHSMDLETNENFCAPDDFNPPILPPMDRPSIEAYPEVEKVRSVPDILEEDGLRATPDIAMAHDFEKQDVIQPVDVPVEEPRLDEDEQPMLSTPAMGVRQEPEPSSPFFQPSEPATDATPTLAVVETPVEAPHKKGTPRKRKQAIDSEVILPSSYFKEMLNDASDLRRVRRKVTDLQGSWVSIFEKERLGKRMFSKPSVQGLCSGLEELYDRAFNPHKRQKTEMSTPTVTFAPDGQPSPAGNADNNVQASPAPSKSTSKVSEAPGIPDNSIQSSKPPQVPEPAASPAASLQQHLSRYVNPSLQEQQEEDVLNLDNFADPITPTTDIAATHETGSRPVAEFETERSFLELDVELVQTENEHTPVIDSSLLLVSSDVVATSSQSEGWSERTRAIAQFLRARFEDAPSAEVSVGGMLRGKTRKEAARFFFETLVLRTNDYVSVKQDVAYGDITIYAQPRLMKAVF